VFVPDILDVPVTASVGVEEPDRTTELIEVGVIAPRDKLIAGVVVAVATEPDTPFAVTTDTDVTVPEPPPPTSAVLSCPSTGSKITPIYVLTTETNVAWVPSV
jgi:hypothetical protein